MHAGFQFVEMALDAKAGLLHKIGGEKSVYGLHHPGVLLHVTVAQPQLHHMIVLSGIHGLPTLRLCCNAALYQFLR